MMLTRIHACIHTYIHKYIHTYIHMCRYNERLESYVSDGEAATSNYTDGLTGVKLQRVEEASYTHTHAHTHTLSLSHTHHTLSLLLSLSWADRGQLAAG